MTKELPPIKPADLITLADAGAFRELTPAERETFQGAGDDAMIAEINGWLYILDREFGDFQRADAFHPNGEDFFGTTSLRHGWIAHP